MKGVLFLTAKNLKAKIPAAARTYGNIGQFYYLYHKYTDNESRAKRGVGYAMLVKIIIKTIIFNNNNSNNNNK